MSRSDRILIAAGGGAAVLALAAVLVLLDPGSATLDPAVPVIPLATPAAASMDPEPSAAIAGTIVVDVAGAVAAPGLHELAAGSRVGDAIAAAGGYGPEADLDAAAATLNLASPLGDGEQVRVPRVGDAIQAPDAGSGTGAAPGAGSGDAGGGLVNLNTATPEQLQALPGIGPVTAQKIVAARQEQPFTSLDDALQRGVIHRGQLEDIQGLATAG